MNSDLKPFTSKTSIVPRELPLYLASSNPGKLREFAAAAALRGVTVELFPGISEIPVCVEDGLTFEANARKKAEYYGALNPGWVFTDDSGICVDLLNGAPGILSARFAGPDANDEQNNRRLLMEIHEAEERNSQVATRDSLRADRSAHYVCVIALAKAGRVVTTVEGRADGLIIDEAHGAGGFGYDPYFYFPPLGKTFAEMQTEEKFVVSHRGEAFRKLLDYLCSPQQ